MNIYQSSTYRKDSGRLHFNKEPRVQEKQQLKYQQSYVSVSVGYLTYAIATRSTRSDMTTVFRARSHGRFIEIKSNLRRKKL